MVRANELSLETKSKGSKCWNGLGKCDDMCMGNTSRKIDYSCQELHTCCVPHKITIPIKSIEEKKDVSGGQSCALNNGKCHVKCLSPLTVYRGSYNECPLRYFCCIQNPKANAKALEEKVFTTEGPNSDSGETKGEAKGEAKGEQKDNKGSKPKESGGSSKKPSPSKKSSDEEGFDD